MTIPIDYFSHLPSDITTSIASQLPIEDRIRLGLLSTIFKKVIENNVSWPLPRELTLLEKPISHKDAVVNNLKRCRIFLWTLFKNFPDDLQFQSSPDCRAVIGDRDSRCTTGYEFAKASEPLSTCQAIEFLRDAFLYSLGNWSDPADGSWSQTVRAYYTCNDALPFLPISREDIEMVLTLGIPLPRLWVQQAVRTEGIPNILTEELLIRCQWFPFVPDDMRVNRDFVLRFIRSIEPRATLSCIFRYLSDRLKKDFEVVRELVFRRSVELRHVDPNTRYIDPMTGEIDPLSKERYAEIAEAASRGKLLEEKNSNLSH